MQTDVNPPAPPTDPTGARRTAGWIRRSYRALVDDLEIVDSGSLDVLLYCADDLAGGDEAPPRPIDRVVES